MTDEKIMVAASTDETPGGGICSHDCHCAPPGADHSPETEGGIVRELGDLPPGAIVEEEALARMFHRHPVSIQRAVKRGELPAPARIMGKPCWTVKAILDHVSKRLDAAQREAEKTAAKFLKLST